MADTAPQSYSSDPTLYLYTSLTAGSSHIITATSRLETILKANRIPFRALDVATDEKARMLWGRRSKGRKLPGLVRCGMIVGDLEEIEEWNEYGELKDQIAATDPTKASSASTATATTSPPTAGSTTSASVSKPPATNVPPSGPELSKIMSPPSPHPPSQHVGFKGDSPKIDAMTSDTEPAMKEQGSSITLALRQAGAEAAKKAADQKSEKLAALKVSLSTDKAKDETGKKVDSSTTSKTPPAVSSPQVREAPTPLPETETVLSTEFTTISDESETSGPIEKQTTITAPSKAHPKADAPPHDYSPRPTPAVSSSSSINLSEADEEHPAPIEHHRETQVSVDAPKEIIEQVEAKQAIPEEKAVEKK